MPPRRPSAPTRGPVQRRHRTEKACNFCRIAKQRCEPTEYGTNDRPCRRCVSQGLDCNLPRAARSQSPSSAFGGQGPVQVRNLITQDSAGGAIEELTPLAGSEYKVSCTLQKPASAQAPTGRWPPLMIRSEERQGSSTIILPPGQIALQAPSLLALASSMEGYQQSFSNVAQGSATPGSGYYFQDCYGHTTYGYATQSVSDDGVPNMEYVVEEPQSDNTGASGDE